MFCIHILVLLQVVIENMKGKPVSRECPYRPTTTIYPFFSWSSLYTLTYCPIFLFQIHKSGIHALMVLTVYNSYGKKIRNL